MKYRVKLYLVVCSLSFHLYGCSTNPTTPTLPKSANPTEGKAYLYGRFDKLTKLGFTFVSFALEIENADRTNLYRLGLVNNDDVQVFEVEPDVYEIPVLTNRDGETTFNQTIIYTKIKVNENIAYYIGDLVYSYDKRAGGCCHLWYLEKFEDNFEDTTISFKKKYPNLAELPISRVDSDLLEQ